jgi:hypothetical protein
MYASGWPSGLASRCTRSEGREPGVQEAEFVAFWVGQDMPALGAGLADVGGPGAEGEQPLQLGILVAVGGVTSMCSRSFPVRGSLENAASRSGSASSMTSSLMRHAMPVSVRRQNRGSIVGRVLKASRSANRFLGDAQSILLPSACETASVLLSPTSASTGNAGVVHGKVLSLDLFPTPKPAG